MKGTLGLTMEKEGLDAELAVILHLLTDAARIIHAGFWEMGDISSAD